MLPGAIIKWELAGGLSRFGDVRRRREPACIPRARLRASSRLFVLKDLDSFTFVG
jgi:hypothetical protein